MMMMKMLRMILKMTHVAFRSMKSGSLDVVFIFNNVHGNSDLTTNVRGSAVVVRVVGVVVVFPYSFRFVVESIEGGKPVGYLERLRFF